MLDDCDYYILILAGRYGTLDKDGIGFTEKSLIMHAKNIPIMSFVFEDSSLIPNGKSEQTDLGKKKLAAFRKKYATAEWLIFTLTLTNSKLM